MAEKAEFYTSLVKQASALLEGEKDIIANSANLSALLFQNLTQVNWAGFYFLDEASQTLILGPFQGKPACVRIPVGRGVCGAAVAEQSIQRVANVHEFQGHIACDSASESEIVLPFFQNGQCKGVLDIDSPILDRFDNLDQEGLQKIVSIFEKSIA
ncbi:GAF domain-containing protein [Algicola sagamiensis]|uniref:GAF domain-containing protein n=1 Tax=Algicola sagamiensis TaxID=163869 RepID=UPI000375D6F3|nr:GAF domain-containing protein [Algicola sagamiensis]